jgi:hypothetical protein
MTDFCGNDYEPALNSPTDIKQVVFTNVITFNEFGVIQFSRGLMSHPLSLLRLSLQAVQNHPQSLDLGKMCTVHRSVNAHKGKGIVIPVHV